MTSAMERQRTHTACLLYTSDAADELDGVDLGGRRIFRQNKKPVSRVTNGLIDGGGGDRTRVLAYCQLNVYTHRQTT